MRSYPHRSWENLVHQSWVMLKRASRWHTLSWEIQQVFLDNSRRQFERTTVLAETVTLTDASLCKGHFCFSLLVSKKRKVQAELETRSASAFFHWNKQLCVHDGIGATYPPLVLPFLLRLVRGSLEANFSSSFHSLSHSSSV